MIPIILAIISVAVCIYGDTVVKASPSLFHWRTLLGGFMFFLSAFPVYEILKRGNFFLLAVLWPAFSLIIMTSVAYFVYGDPIGMKQMIAILMVLVALLIV